MKLFKGIGSLIFIYISLLMVYDIQFSTIFICSYLLHEIFHIIVIYLLKFKIEEVYLIPFGGQIKMNGNKNHNPFYDVVIYLAGPLANLFLLINGLVLKSNMLKDINLILFSFNILPIMPLDGFYIFSNLLALKIPYYYALKITLIISLILAFVLLCVAYLINFSLIILSIYMIIITINELKNNYIYKGLLMEKISNINIGPNKEIKPTIKIKKIVYKGLNTYFSLGDDIYYDKNFFKK